jgi:hypothetical protein
VYCEYGLTNMGRAGAVVIEDGRAIEIMGAVVAGLTGAVGYLWWEMRSERKRCDKRIHTLWLYICNILGMDKPMPPELDDMPPLQPAARSGHLYDSKRHPTRRKSDASDY